MHNFIITISVLLMFLNPQCDDSSNDPDPGQYPPIIIFETIDQIDLHTDTADISKAEVEGRYLTLTVSYSGGCKEHEFALFGWSGFAKSNPPQAEVFLSHNANGDMCEAYLTEEIKFDLLPLQHAYQKIFSDKGPFMLNIYAPGVSEPFMPKPVYDF
ncbi:hypothetical protein GF337_19225 [candidate division KSB1 bacterium]|nr:hypothetical protein [candidate division KSB1 bacterium]